jgi:ubiquinone/menaquinone biosynthesis C-methylase UbiE
MKSVVAKNSKVYYRGKYWNDYKVVKRYMNRELTGNKDVWWMLDFQRRYAKNPFKKALFLNCGDGRHERKFLNRKIAEQVVAFDYSESLLKKARRLGKGKKIEYFQADANAVDFPENSFDLVVNIASLHHIQYLNRMCYIIAKSLKPGGIFMSFDYIGPSRNQYPKKQWQLTKKINSRLPKTIKKDKLDYPHLPTMMVTDPTEAIHSGMIMEAVKKYFDFIHLKFVGGGVAYTLLSQNPKLDKLKTKEAEKIIEKVLNIDHKYTKQGLMADMFTYFIATQKKRF